MEDRYEVILYWSAEDGAVIAEVPGCLAHGATQSEAIQNVCDAMDLWLATATEFGDPIPQPKGRRLMLA